MDSTKVPLGGVVGPLEYYCDPDEIAAFALAINDDNPQYQQGRAVPPTYAVVPVFEAFRRVASVPNEAIQGAGAVGHGEHDLLIHQPITPGMTLHTTSERCSVVVSKAGMNVFTRLVSVDDRGELATEQYWSTIYAGEVTGGDQGREMPDHTFPTTAREALVGKVALGTTRDQTFRYAGASGDRSPLHVSDRVARAAGYPRKFNQGACTLGIASKALVDHAADGDPSRIRRLAVRFSRSAFPGEDVVVSLFRAGRSPTGLDAYAFEAVSGGEKVLRNGWLEVSAG